MQYKYEADAAGALRGKLQPRAPLLVSVCVCVCVCLQPRAAIDDNDEGEGRLG